MKTIATLALLLVAAAPSGFAADQPWMNAALPSDERARLLDEALKPDERQSLLHGIFAVSILGPKPEAAIGAAGYVPGVARLGIPPLQETDASLGVANPFNVRPGDTATPLPSGLALAATWNVDLAYRGGAMIGQEAWRKGFNVLLGGGVNLARDPRNGRNFEYLGEDPLLAGMLDGAMIRGTQDQHVVSTAKHFALNDQETGRHVLDARIGEAAFRESDLLAFELALETGHPGSVMCAYNKVNGPYACGSNRLLNEILKGDWSYPGWVMSDWGAVYDWSYANAGLDQESGEQLDKSVWFGPPLQQAIQTGGITRDRVSDMARRILRSMFAVGAFDHPPAKMPIDAAADAAIAKKEADEGFVLLTNRDNLLPLRRDAKRILVIGGHADVGVLSGGGSAQVVPVGGPALTIPLGRAQSGMVKEMLFDPSAPLQAIKAKATGAAVTYDGGGDPATAAALARGADAVVVFATQWMMESEDAPDLTLPDGQDALIAAVTAANPKTVVVLETGGPVLMPWRDAAGAVVEAWYPGARGGEAIADLLFGDTNPSGRLPITFPAGESQLPRPKLPGAGLPEGQAFAVDYSIEGSNVGYRWYAAKALKPLFPFGFGLSYTQFAYSNPTVSGGDKLSVGFDVKNTGTRPGMDVPQLYLTDASGKPHVRLLGWSKVTLAPGAITHVALKVDPRLVADFDETAHCWRIAGGTYKIAIGRSAEDFVLTGEADLDDSVQEP
jgi:beta-glucosidase